MDGGATHFTSFWSAKPGIPSVRHGEVLFLYLRGPPFARGVLAPPLREQLTTNLKLGNVIERSESGTPRCNPGPFWPVFLEAPRCTPDPFGPVLRSFEPFWSLFWANPGPFELFFGLLSPPEPFFGVVRALLSSFLGF